MTNKNKVKHLIEINNKTIDLTPANDLIKKLESKVFSRKKWDDRNHIKTLTEITGEIQELTPVQKNHFISYLISKASSNYDLFLSAIEDSKQITEYKQFLKEYPKKQ